MPLDKLTLLWEDNQFGRKRLFKFDRITASELETGISIVPASSHKDGEYLLNLDLNAYLNPLFLFIAFREQHLSDNLC